jgi:DNA replication protein DnaC
MSEKIDKTLKKIATGISKGSSPTSSSTKSQSNSNDLPGDPNCPYCHGVGFLRRDLPVGHPDFGKLEICTCRTVEISQQVRQRLFSLSNLSQLRDLTFENFNSRGRVGLWPQQADSLEQAYNQAKHFSQTLKGWLLLEGDYGCGKTHLAAAIANFAVGIGVPTLFITVPDLLDSLRFAYQGQENSFEDRFEDIRSAALLILDDFGTQNATPWAQEKLFQILNYRYINHLPLVVTTNLALEQIEGRIRSRLEDPELVTSVHILATDYRNPMKDIGHHELSSLGLMNNRTFASFDLRTNENIPSEDLKSLEKALRAARRFAEKPQGWLVFTGPYGCGKTHLAAAIANYRADMGDPPLFVVVPDLLDHLRATFTPTSSVSLDRRFEEVRTTKLLILDDLGTQSMTPWVREKLYQLFNYRYNAELPTVVTTADALEEMDPRLRSRMLDRRICTIYPINGVPVYRGEHNERLRATRRSRSTRK